MGENPEASSDYPRAEVRRKKRFSLVWLIPIVAVVVGLIMAVQAIVTKGPLITISFSSASGLVAGETKIRYKDVTVGLVEMIQLSEDLSTVIVEARMDPSIKPYLLETTQFWIETARISAGEISGLGTLLSGAYIGMDPGVGKTSERVFVGSDSPPVITTGLPGKSFYLEAESLGSVNVRSPVYYRQIKVGEVVGHRLKEDGSGVRTQIFINQPYDRFVKTSSRFWNASGIDFRLDAKGVKINTESVTSLLYGGIAFETPVGFEAEAVAEQGDVFPLFRDYDESKEERFFTRNYYFAHFPHSIRGLEPGAPVEFLGFKVGEVVDMKLEFEIEKDAFLAPVLFYVEPDRVDVRGEGDIGSKKLMERMVARGLRVQLKNGNLLTGQLNIDLVIDKKAKQEKIDYSLAHPRLPTIPSDVEALTSSVRAILEDMKQVEFKEVGKELRSTMAVMKANLEKTDRLFGNLNEQTLPKVESAIEEIRAATIAIRNSVDNDSDLNHDARVALAELTEAARSVKVLTDYLGQHPEALLRGKGESE